MSFWTYGIFGFEGRGKTLSATILCYQKYQEGYSIYHNGGLNFGEEVELDKIVNLQYHHAVIFIDEAHTSFDSRRAMAMFNVEASNFLIQRRKLDVNFIYATHYPSLVDIRINRLSDYAFYCEYKKADDVVLLNIVDEWGHHSYPGTRRRGVFHQVSKYFPLFDTTTIRPLTLNRYDSKSSQERGRISTANKILEAIAKLVELGNLKATTLDIYNVLRMNKVDISAQTIGGTLSKMGYATSKSGGRRMYPIGEIFRDNQASEAISTLNTSELPTEDSNELDVGQLVRNANQVTPKLITNSRQSDAQVDDLIAIMGPDGTPYKYLLEIFESAGYSEELLMVELRERKIAVTDGMVLKV